MMKKYLKRYAAFLAALAASLVLLAVKPDAGAKAFAQSAGSLWEMLMILPPVFVLIGLMDTWVEKETMMRLMGEGSGILGVLTAFLLGSFAAGPLYVCFPVVGVLMKKGAKFGNVVIFIGAWSATKIPIALFEGSVMGWKFMLTRYAIDVPVIILIAWLMEKLIPAREKALMYERALSPQ